jgi:hypothetical protein
MAGGLVAGRVTLGRGARTELTAGSAPRRRASQPRRAFTLVALSPALAGGAVVAATAAVALLWLFAAGNLYFLNVGEALGVRP